MSPHVAAELDRVIARPASLSSYKFDHPVGGAPDTAEAFAFDTNVRQAMQELGLPEHVGSYAYSAATGLLERFADASEADVRAHCGKVTAQLQARWGDTYRARMDAVLDPVATVDGPVGGYRG